MSLKTALLKPNTHVEKHTLFGTEVNLRRLTVAELDQYDQSLKDSNGSAQANIVGASLILSAICDENGQPLPAKELPTAEELIAAHDSPTLIKAVTSVQKYCYGSVEEAKKN